MSFHIRTATDEENDLIYQIIKTEGRYTREWNSGPVLVACDEKTNVVKGWVRHWISQAKRNMVMSLTVDQTCRGNKLGLHLITNLMQNTENVTIWHLDCRPSLESYYGTLGYIKKPWSVVPELFGPDDPPDQLCMTCTKKDFVPYPKPS